MGRIKRADNRERNPQEEEEEEEEIMERLGGVLPLKQITAKKEKENPNMKDSPCGPDDEVEKKKKSVP